VQVGQLPQTASFLTMTFAHRAGWEPQLQLGQLPQAGEVPDAAR